MNSQVCWICIFWHCQYYSTLHFAYLPNAVFQISLMMVNQSTVGPKHEMWNCLWKWNAFFDCNFAPTTVQQSHVVTLLSSVWQVDDWILRPKSKWQERSIWNRRSNTEKMSQTLCSLTSTNLIRATLFANIKMVFIKLGFKTKWILLFTLIG